MWQPRCTPCSLCIELHHQREETPAKSPGSAQAALRCAHAWLSGSSVTNTPLSVAGGRDITMRVEDSMHAFWGVLEWSANTILFVW